MKNLLTLIIFLCSINCSAIVSKKDSATNHFEYGIRSGIYQTSYIGRITYYSHFTMKKGIHEFGVGPSISRGKHYFYPSYWTSEHLESYTLSGFDFFYKIFPNGSGKIFEFYFQLDLLQKWSSGTDEYVKIYNFPNQNEITIDEVEIKSRATSLILEYGFDIKFLKHFYIGGSLGIGYGIEFLDYNYQSHSQFDYKLRRLELDGIARCNLGFRF